MPFVILCRARSLILDAPSKSTRPFSMSAARIKATPLSGSKASLNAASVLRSSFPRFCLANRRPTYRSNASTTAEGGTSCLLHVDKVAIEPRHCGVGAQRREIMTGQRVIQKMESGALVFRHDIKCGVDAEEIR